MLKIHTLIHEVELSKFMYFSNHSGGGEYENISNLTFSYSKKIHDGLQQHIKL